VAGNLATENGSVLVIGSCRSPNVVTHPLRSELIHLPYTLAAAAFSTFRTAGTAAPLVSPKKTNAWNYFHESDFCCDAR
jgi:hypothetical protein